MDDNSEKTTPTTSTTKTGADGDGVNEIIKYRKLTPNVSDHWLKAIQAKSETVFKPSLT